jgi:hypothetical protein
VPRTRVATTTGRGTAPAKQSPKNSTSRRRRSPSTSTRPSESFSRSCSTVPGWIQRRENVREYVRRFVVQGSFFWPNCSPFLTQGPSTFSDPKLCYASSAGVTKTRRSEETRTEHPSYVKTT